MQKFIGVKLIAAVAMTALAYHEYRGWNLADGKDPNAEGYLVEYEPDPNSPPNHENHAGYISWSPKHVFEDAYRPINGMTFGLAIEALKRGHKVARAGWNGKGMWLILTHGRVINNIEPNSFYERCGFEAPVTICSHIDMKAADGSMVVGWLASQTDMLAEDWSIVE